MSDIDELTKLSIKFRDERNWKQFHSPKELAISLMLEAGELLEQFKWKTPAEVTDYINSNKQQVEEEIADIFYHILVLSHDLKIDLSRAYRNKILKNQTKYPLEKAKGNNKKYTEL